MTELKIVYKNRTVNTDEGNLLDILLVLRDYLDENDFSAEEGSMEEVFQDRNGITRFYTDAILDSSGRFVGYFVVKG